MYDLADSRFLAFSKPPAANTMKVNNSSSKISDVSVEWISANLDQISLSIFGKRVSLNEWKEKTLYFRFCFPLSSGFKISDILTFSYAVQSQGSSFILRNDIRD